MRKIFLLVVGGLCWLTAPIAVGEHITLKSTVSGWSVPSAEADMDDNMDTGQVATFQGKSNRGPISGGGANDLISWDGFTFCAFDPDTGSLSLSDGSHEALATETLETSHHDGALLCRVKAELRDGGLMARFGHSAQAALLDVAEETDQGPALRIGGILHLLPPF